MPKVKEEKKNPIQERTETLMDMLQSPRMKQQMTMALPKHLSTDRLIRIIMTAVRRNGQLLQCTKQSIAACAMTCAALGLEPEPFLGQAYLVPFRNKSGYLEAQLIPGYRGYISLARRSGAISSIASQVVHAKDHFEYEFGVNAKLVHRPSRDADPGPPMGAYVFLKYKDGSESFDFMSTEQIEKIRKRSKTPNDGPWVTDWEEMAKKTVIRRHLKIAPISSEITRLSTLDERAEIGETQDGILLESEEMIESEASGSLVYEHKTPDISDFDAKFKVGLTPELAEKIDLFVKVSADANHVGGDRIKTEALKDPTYFMKVFKKWLTESEKAPPEADPEKPEMKAETNPKPGGDL